MDFFVQLLRLKNIFKKYYQAVDHNTLLNLALLEKKIGHLYKKVESCRKNELENTSIPITLFNLVH